MGLPSSSEQRRIIYKAAKHYGIKPSILWGLYGTETSFGRNVSNSSAGAVGPFQFLPSTARAYGVNPYDFKSAAYGAAKYLSQYKSRGTGGMLSAYNAGPAGGYQSGYVHTTLSNARSWKPPVGGGSSGSSGSSSGGGGSLSQTLRTVTSSSRSLPTPGDPSGVLALLQQSAPPQPNVTAPLQAPSFSARANLQLPSGYQTPSVSPAPSSGDSLSQRLSAVAGLGGGQVPHTTVSGSQSLSSVLKGGDGGGSSSGGGRHRGTTGGVLSRGTLGRTDMGVDFTGSGTIPAVGSGTITRVVPRGGPSGWPGGGFVVLKLDNPPDARHRYVYIAENISPTVRVGQRVKAGERIAHAHGSYPYLEIGWAADSHGTTLAHATTGYHEGQVTTAGKSFKRWLGF